MEKKIENEILTWTTLGYVGITTSPESQGLSGAEEGGQ